MLKSAVLYLTTMALLTAGIIWLTSQMFADISGSGKSVAIGGYSGSYMDVAAGSEVCVKGIAEDGYFEVTTPSGKFTSQAQIGRYYFGEGCFAPGRWTFTGVVPAMLLTNPDGLTAHSYVAANLRSRMNFVMIGFSAAVLGFGFWLQSRMENSRMRMH